jgi:hypothetical protein
MLTVQPRLPHALASARRRSVRRPFTPAQQGRGHYRLPHEIQDRLTTALAPYRNREAAFALATFLARFWSMPRRVTEAFPIDRRELTDRPDLGLTEKRVRNAIRVLEEIGFLDRAIPSSGSRYKATEDGLHRKPILFVFGTEYAPAFLAANRRAAAARGDRSQARRPVTPSSSTSQPTPSASTLKGPKSRNPSERSVIMGPLVKNSLPPKAFEPDPKLESALDRLLQGIRQSRGG